MFIEIYVLNTKYHLKSLWTRLSC